MQVCRTCTCSGATHVCVSFFVVTLTSNSSLHGEYLLYGQQGRRWRITLPALKGITQISPALVGMNLQQRGEIVKVLLINAHHRYPGWSEGNLNASAISMMVEFFSARGDDVITTNIDEGYDPAEEEHKHLEADLVILQTPVNWFGAPWTWKKYIDETFTVGLHSASMLTGDGRSRSDATRPYGSGGKLTGRKFMISATWNAPESAFTNTTNPVFLGLSADHALSALSAPYRFCGYEVLPTFHFFDIFKNPTLETDLQALPSHLEAVLSGETHEAKAEVKKHFEVDVRRLSTKHYEATNSSGARLEFGSGEGLLNPVELLLAAVAGCGSIDVDHVTTRRAEPTHFHVHSEADKISEEGAARLENVLATFDVRFPDDAEGAKAAQMVPRVLRIAEEKDCTVSRTVAAPTKVEFRTVE